MVGLLCGCAPGAPDGGPALADLQDDTSDTSDPRSEAAADPAPTAEDQSAFMDEDTSTHVTLVASVMGNTSLEYQVFSPPAHGQLVGVLPHLTYEPDANWSGEDQFSWLVRTASGKTDTAVFRLTVVPTNDAPHLEPVQILGVEDQPVTFTLQASDPDGDPTTYVITEVPAHGDLTGTGPTFTYTPYPDWFDWDTFKAASHDGQLQSASVTIRVYSEPVPDPPVAVSHTTGANEDTAVSVHLEVYDPDGGPVITELLSQPLWGDLSGAAPNLTFTPDANFNGLDSFTFRAFDGDSYSAIATQTLQLNSTNDPPTAADVQIVTDEDTPVQLTLLGNDIDGDELYYTAFPQPQGGSVVITGATAEYRPPPNFHGVMTFDYHAYDGRIASNRATVEVVVMPLPDAPFALPIGEAVNEDESVAITLLGFDYDGDALTFSISAAPDHGTLSGIPPAVTYTPRPDFSGSDSFSYTVEAGGEVSPAVDVIVQVSEINDPPVASDVAVSTQAYRSVNVVLPAHDADSVALAFDIAPPAHGAVYGTGPEVVYTPEPGFTGVDVFTFTVRDAIDVGNTATATVTVMP